jgi:hypothetical protein
VNKDGKTSCFMVIGDPFYFHSSFRRMRKEGRTTSASTGSSASGAAGARHERDVAKRDGSGHGFVDGSAGSTRGS